VLIAVHVVIAVHIAHWLTAGDTLSPVEPSESMRTLELGEVNAGFIFFAAAILATLAFGRFFCGWGCHIVALQDLCGWMMKKAGVRPKPFRSRVLVFVPLVLAVYMFVWPTLKRVVIAPLAESWWPTVRTDLRVAPFPEGGFTNHLVTGGFWDTFPSWGVAVPFLLVCGFATVYFLGAKGFCTYGCPYGGVFGPVDSLSPGRIVVDSDKCHQCGHCTAVCTSNVRVHDEVREYGMVVDPGCMKCMDCVSVCPNGALSFGFARPPIRKGEPKHSAPQRVYDTTLGEDAGLAAVMLVTFLALRGAYDAVPMLMAVGMAGIAAYLAWKAWRLTRDANVRVARAQVKRAGRLTLAGVGFVVLFVLGAVLVAHTGVVNALRWRADRIYERLAISKQAVLAPDAPPLPADTVERAGAALRAYSLAAGVGRGGMALASTPSAELRRGLMALAAGDAAQAEDSLRFVMARTGPADELTSDLARVMVLQGKGEEAVGLLQSTLREHPEFWGVREDLAPGLVLSGRGREAIDEARLALTRVPAKGATREAHARTRLTLARLLEAGGDRSGALDQFRGAVESMPKSAILRQNLAAALERIDGDVPGAIEQLREAARLAPGDAMIAFQTGRLELARGKSIEALQAFERADTLAKGSSDQRRAIVSVLRSAGLEREAAEWAAKER